jgi:peptidoglycan biosynthesis protein MviN/MurJ (putative lipid II flippase)
VLDKKGTREMNWNLIAFIGLMAIFVVAFLVMLYFQWVDGYVRKWRWERAERKAQEQ